MIEYRLWITIQDLPFEAEERWLPFSEHLESSHPGLGPVFTWSADAMVAIVATTAADEAAAAERGVAVVAQALHASGLGDHYPASVEVEAVPESELQPA